MLGAVGPVKPVANRPKGRGADHPAAGLRISVTADP